MFSGLIEAVGTVSGVEPVTGGRRLAIDTPWTDVSPGESVAVNGVCLTVTEAPGGCLHADVGPETLRATALGRLEAGRAVNLERALRAGDRIGGHFVQGHVDGVGRMLARRPAADFTWLAFSYPSEHAAWIILKGSIAVDGVSLTVAVLDGARFEVQVVPYTWTHTTLSRLHAGDLVNLEFDLLGKYAVRAAEVAAERRQPAPSLP